jgi:hypothetical protein
MINTPQMAAIKTQLAQISWLFSWLRLPRSLSTEEAVGKWQFLVTQRDSQRLSPGRSRADRRRPARILQRHTAKITLVTGRPLAWRSPGSRHRLSDAPAGLVREGENIG